MRALSLLALLVVPLAGWAQDAPTSPRRNAAELLAAAAVEGGLVVDIGCASGRHTAALRVHDRYIVHGLDTDPEAVRRARDTIRSLGLYGPVSVDTFDGKHLPYAEDTVNLLIADELGDLSAAEIMRVLVPGGVSWINGVRTVKPHAEALDEWSHFLHDASNNAVARDRAVGPPRRLRWVCGPLWSRSHEFISSIAALVSAGGRVFYVVDEGITSVTDPRLPERWYLCGRDAFNGILLWKRPLPEWRGQEWRNTALRARPASVPRRLVAHGDRLYATLSRRGPLEILDAATGTTLSEVPGTANTQEVLFADGLLLLYAAEIPERGAPPSGHVMAVDPATGVIRWQTPAARYRSQTLCTASTRVFYHTGGDTVCLNRANGSEHWRQADPDARERRTNVTTLVAYGGLVLACDGRLILARDAATGEIRWQTATGGRCMRGEDMFVARNCVWHATGENIVGFDLATGTPRHTIDPSPVLSAGHHLRCYRSKATENYLITQFRGAEFISLTGDRHVNNDWVRGPCRYGIMPANGLLYAPPDPCFCYPGAKLNGFLALAPATAAGTALPARNTPGPRLERGPAYVIPDNDASSTTKGDWPTYRHDPRRSGAASCSIAPRLTRAWSIDLPGPLTPPVVADGRLYVAAKDEHTLYAAATDSGRILWHVTAGARIDSPPTIAGDRVLFGCADGSVYCVRASDGNLAWRFRTGPADRRIVAFNQLESPWRVHGSVLAANGLVYLTSGRSSFLDGGIRILGIETATGLLRFQTTIDTWAPTRTDAVGKPFVPAHHIEGARSDILVCEDNTIYLGQYAFTPSLDPIPAPYELPDPDRPVTGLDITRTAYTATDPILLSGELTQRSFHRYLERAHPDLTKQYIEMYGGANLGDRRTGPHLTATAGFLDDAWFNRTYWIYTDGWPGWYHAHRGARSGQLVVVGRERTYAVQAYPTRNRQSPLFTPGQDGYLLLADSNATEPVLPDDTRGATKGIGYTRAAPPVWFDWVGIRIRAMVEAGDVLAVAGVPDLVPENDPMAALDGRRGAVLRLVSAGDGTILSQQDLTAPPVFDGLIAADAKLFLVSENSRITCFAAAPKPPSTAAQQTLAKLRAEHQATRERHLENARNRTIGRQQDRAPQNQGARLPKDDALPRANWRVIRVSSSEPTHPEFAPAKMLDHDVTTSWHSRWVGGRDPFPHDIVIDLGAPAAVRGLDCLPRQDRAQNGRVKTCAVYLSRDGATWGNPVTTGEFADTLDEKRLSFTPVTARYVRFVVLSGYDTNLTAIAELNVLGEGADDAP